MGIPVQENEETVTMGYLIKAQYILPPNSSTYTDQIFNYAHIIESRRLPESGTHFVHKIIANDPIFEDKTNSSKDDSVLLDINYDFNDETKQKSTGYMEGGEIDLEAHNIATKLGTRKFEGDVFAGGGANEKNEDNNKDPNKRNISRWDIYKIMEHLAEQYGMSGRACMLRCICEAADVQFSYRAGLLSEVIHILLTPSTTQDHLSHHADNEYFAAEVLGQSGVPCARAFSECDESVLDLFTKVALFMVDNLVNGFRFFKALDLG